MQVSRSQVKGTTPRADAAPEAFGNVIVHSTPDKANEPSVDGDRAAASLPSRCDYPVL
jgi:hypothetical protein